MTTLADIITHPLPPVSTLRGMWLAFDPTLQLAINDAQADATAHRVAPVSLTDGRVALCADVLSEIGDGGIFSTQFTRLDPANFAAVELIDDAIFRALLPPPSDEI